MQSCSGLRFGLTGDVTRSVAAAALVAAPARATAQATLAPDGFRHSETVAVRAAVNQMQGFADDLDGDIP
jgi:hypothetical protein